MACGGRYNGTRLIKDMGEELKIGVIYNNTNEMILVNNVGAKAIAAKGYMTTRKIGKVHQNVLCFYKGDTGKIQENYPELDLRHIDEEEVYNG
tara:strand:- start:18 stop:296 length:279 start_codon:yes stop_codon:yes gene_type:complete